MMKMNFGKMGPKYKKANMGAKAQPKMPVQKMGTAQKSIRSMSSAMGMPPKWSGSVAYQNRKK